tara:strand:- start:1145 stop:1333 length:189 start_codon:yes stop_codon:yes gene_type:complete
MSSNPYELRQALLQQAQKILEHQYHSEVAQCDRKGVACNAKSPTTEDIITEAEKLYAFVQTK